MSLMGHKQTSHDVCVTSALPLADLNIVYEEPENLA